MTTLERMILKYVAEQCDMARPPRHYHIANRFAPESTTHIVNALWAQGYLARPCYGRKGSHRPFIITENGRAMLREAVAA